MKKARRTGTRMGESWGFGGMEVKQLKLMAAALFVALWIFLIWSVFSA